MIPVFVVLFVIIFIVFRNDIISPVDGEIPFFKRHKNWLIAMVITFVPVILFNIFIPYEVLTGGDSYLEAGKKKYDEQLQLEGYRKIAVKHPDSIPIQLNYINYAAKYGSEADELRMISQVKPAVQWKNELCHLYIKYYTRSRSFDINEIDYLGTEKPYTNYFRGQYYLNAARYSKSIPYLEKETLINPNFGRPYQRLQYLYLKTNPNKIHELMVNEFALPHININARINYYFYYANYWMYFKTLLQKRFSNTKFITYLSAFIVSLVWMLFLRSIDIFRKEKWTHLAIVFVLGSFLTFFCHFVYDYAQHHLSWGINGNAFNDLKYCIVVIGGGEELVKLLGWLPFVFFFKKAKEPIDFIIYSSAAAIGFAFIENLHYFSDDINVLIRTLTSSTEHMIAGSFVGYGFALAKFKYQDKSWRNLLPILGFLAAILSHGLYDVFLISPAYFGSEYLYLIPFLIGLMLWFVVINNCLNNSPFFKKDILINPQKLSYFISYLILGILMFQFMLISIRTGANYANYWLLYGSFRMGFFLVILSILIYQIKLVQGSWYSMVPKLKFTGFKSPYFDSINTTAKKKPKVLDDFSGLKLRIFASKTNKYVGGGLPESGYCIKRITVDTDPNWYIFKTVTPIVVKGIARTYFVIKPKEKSNNFYEDKIMVYFMIIHHTEKLKQSSLKMKDLRYTGIVYSRPVIE